MRKTLNLILLFIFLIPEIAGAANKPVTVLPFEMAGTYIVVKLRINDSAKLRFILDTGVRNTIITSLFPDDSISITLAEKREMKGLGFGADMNALMSYNNTITLGKLNLNNRTIMVLENDVFNLNRYTGLPINGIIGVDLLKDHVVYINYTTQKIYFYTPGNFVIPKGFGTMPMKIEGQKMFIQLSVLETDSAHQNIKMLIDTGAQLNAWFQTLTNKAVNIPEKSIHGRIGEGFGGEITGYYARVPQICIANFCVKNPVVAFPDSSTISSLVVNTDRDGTIGSQLLSRFNLIINFPEQIFGFKPNMSFKNPFTYNIAGLEVAQALSFVPQAEVINVWRNSPAEKAGVMKGDIITQINDEFVFGMTISQVRGFFEKPSTKPMKITIQRDSETMELTLDMTPKI